MYLLLLRLSLSLCDPIDGSQLGSTIPGILRQKHRSWLPFPSPMQKSEKWKWSHSVVSDSSRPHGLQPTRLLRPWDFPDKSTGVGCLAFSVYLLPFCNLLLQFSCVLSSISFSPYSLRFFISNVLFCFCVSIAGFWFVVMGLTYVNI